MMDQPMFDHMNGNSDKEVVDEYWPLSGEPYFSLILAKSHFAPLYQLNLPAKIHRSLPPTSCPMLLEYRGKKWGMTCNALHRRKYAIWKNFVMDNDLNVGDACVFELSNNSDRLIEFKVQILKGDSPLELVEKDDGTIDTPIVID